jgi:hypothetical protein
LLLNDIYIEKSYFLEVIVVKRSRRNEVFPHFASAIRSCGELALDEGESLVAVDVDVLLMVVGVVSVAAVRVLGVAVALDDAGAGRRAGEASGAGSEALSLAGADIVGETIAVVGVAHEDCDLNGLESVSGKGGARATADGVVHNLTSLY